MVLKLKHDIEKFNKGSIMINLEELLKKLKSNKEIEFERLKKEFIKDDVIIELGNCKNHLQKNGMLAMAGKNLQVKIENWRRLEVYN